MSKPTIALLAASIAATSCAAEMTPNTRLMDIASNYLGQPVTAITDRRAAGPTETNYTAVTQHGSYSCTINGGGLLAGGMINTNLTTCTKQATMAGNSNPAKVATHRPVTQAQRDASRIRASAAPASPGTDNAQRQQVASRSVGLSQ